MPRITYQSLLVSGTQGWHDGSGAITYSFLGTELPRYYRRVDTDGDGIRDSRDVGSGTILLTGQDFSMTTDERAMASLAIEAWNEVANVNLVPGTIGGSSSSAGSPITGDGTLVNAGGVAVPTNDDGYTTYDFSAVFEEGLNFFGTDYAADAIYVNTNGSISFNSGISTFTPSSISAGTTAMIAPFWADVDTRAGSPITVDVDATADVVTITWENVGYYSHHTSPSNSFQLQLFDRGSGDFDIVFRYENIGWTTGDASGGTDGLGGTVAHAGFSAGNGADFFELPQSGDQGGILGLDTANGNTGVSGMWVFEVRDGALFGDITFGSSAFLRPNGTANTGLFGFVSDFPLPANLGDTPSRHGDLWINSNNPNQDLTAFGHTSWNTYLHELGHGLGLRHPDEDPNNTAGASNNNNQWTVMSYVAHPGEAGESLLNQAYSLTPMVFDIQALQELYGANLDTRTSDTTYFGAGDGSTDLEYQYGADQMLIDGGDGVNRDVMLTIWDAGGRDQIDASDLTTRVQIDLRPGNFSTIGGLSNNVAMAAAVRSGGRIVNYIEDAEGGTGGDTIRGNNARNILGGNDGNDRLFGYNDNDQLYGDAGRDTLTGGGGNDWLYGGDGNDNLRGNGGRDQFVFMDGEGRDTIRDFGDDVDTLRLDEALWGGGMTAQQVIDTYASVVSGNIQFNFGDGERVTLLGFSNLAEMTDDLALV